MRLICPSCSSQYNVDASLFPEEGREVQCAQCEHKWVQYPEPDPEPVQLTQPNTPSAALPEAEREAIRSAVRDEISMHEQDAIDAKTEEEDLMRALREQLADDDGDYDSAPEDDRVSGRRSVNRAADIAGVALAADSQRDDGKKSKATPKEAVKPNDLASALQEYERERGPRRSGRAGFILALLVCALAAGAYFGRNEIATQFPAALPYLEQYVGIVDQSRDQVVKYWGMTTEFLTDKIESAMAPAEAEEAATDVAAPSE